ncbi:MAG: DUF3662 domain-containing protein [Collinsella sp.]
MNFLNIFEDRVAGIFGAAQAPFSFKKLAKQAAREMEDQTLVINGVNTAPALYTVLIAADDDQLLAPYYSQLASEVTEFVRAQAEKKRYRFVGTPLVRFMIDPSLKPGKFSVFAENVDAPTLARLYEEERAYLKGRVRARPRPPRRLSPPPRLFRRRRRAGGESRTRRRVQPRIRAGRRRRRGRRPLRARADAHPRPADHDARAARRAWAVPLPRPARASPLRARPIWRPQSPLPPPVRSPNSSTSRPATPMSSPPPAPPLAVSAPWPTSSCATPT